MTKLPGQPGSGSGLLEEIVSSIPVRLFWKDRDSRFLGCNELFARDAGFSHPDELIGKTDFDMPWKNQASSYRMDDLSVMESRMSKLGYEQFKTTASGRSVWLHTSKAPLFDENGDVIGVLGISEDITAQKTAESLQHVSEERFHALFDQSPLAIQIVAVDGRTVRVNKAWEKLWGVPFEALEHYNLLEDRYLLENGLMPLIKKALHGETVLMPEVAYDKAASPEVFDTHGKVWVHTNIFPLMHADGSMREIVLVHEDVSERRQMEQELAEKREQHEMAQQIAELGHWTLDLVNNNLIWSDETYRIFGVEPGVGNNYETFLGIVHPDDVAFVNQAYAGHVENRTPYDIEHRLLLPDGSIKWVNERCKTWYADDGTPLRSVGTVLDVTQRKQAELALHEAMEKYQALVESSSDWMWEVDEKGAYTYASPKVEEVLGYKPFEVLGKLPFDFMPADEAERIGEIFKEIVKKREPINGLENRNLHRNGHVVVLETSGVPVFDKQGRFRGYRGIDRDVTERVQAEEALKSSEARFHAFVANLPGVAFLKDVDGRHLLVNRAGERVFGRSQSEVLGKTVFDLFPADVANVMAANDREVIESRQSASIEECVRMGDRDVIYESIIFPIFGDDGEVVGSGGIALDITERKQVEHELQRFRNLVDESNDAVYVIDVATAGFLDVNERACKSLGYSRDELLDMSAMDIQMAFPASFSWQKHVQGLKKAGSMMMEGTHRRKDDSNFPVEVSIKYVSGEGGDSIIAIARDVSERKRMEQELAEKRKLHEMAQQIAHLGHWTRDLTENDLVWSDEIYRIFGVEPGKADTLEDYPRAVHPEDVDFVNQAYAAHVENRSPYDIEYRLLMPDGSVKWVQDRCQTWYAEDGTPLRSVGTTQDVTSSKLLEETLYLTAHHGWDSGDFFQVLATHLAQSLGVDYAMIGMLQDDKMVRTVAFHAHGKIAENVEYSLRHTPCENVVGSSLCYYERGIQQLFPDDTMLVDMGAESYVGIPLWNSKGDPLGLIALLDSKPLANESLVKSLLQAVAVKASAELEQRQSEQALRDSTVRAETLFGAITDAVFVHEVSEDGHVGKFVEVNDVACQKLGYTREELLNMAPVDIDAPDTNVDLGPLIRKLFAGESITFEQVHVAKDGRRIPVEIHARLFKLKGETAVISLVRDISERGLAEEVRRRFEHIVSTSTDILALLDTDFVYLAVNPAYLAAWKKNRDELVGHQAAEVVGEEFFETWMRPNALRCLSGETVNFQAWYKYPAYEQRYMDFNYYPYTDAGGKVIGFAINGRNMTERHEAEQALEKYKLLFSQSDDIAYICDNIGNILYVNDAFERLTGHEAKAFTGKSFAPLFDEANLARAMDNYQRTLQGESPRFELTFKETGVICEYKNAPLKDDAGNIIGVLGVARDIRERKLAEAELHRAMHSLGERMKELRCLYDLSRLAESKIGSLDEFMRKAVELLPSGWQYPKITCACIVFEGQKFRTENFACSKWCLARPIVVNGKQCGEVKVCCFESVPDMDGTPFLKEEEELIEVIAGQLGRIVQQKTTERLQQVSEARFRTLFEQSSLAMQIVGVDGWTQRVNSAWERLWGVPFEALAEYNLFQDRQLIDAGVLPLIRKVFAGESVQVPELEYDREASAQVPGQEGKLWVRTNISPLLDADGEIREIVLVQEDISESKRMELELAGQRERHEIAQQIAHLGHWRLDLVNNRLEWSDENFRIFGREPGTGNTYETFLQIVYPEDVEFVNEAYTSHVKNRTPYNIEHRLLMTDGSVKWVNERCETWYGEDGAPLHSIGTTLDITQRKLAEEELSMNRMRLQGLIEMAPDGIFIADMDGHYTDVNEAGCRMLGLEPDEIIGKTIIDLIPPQDVERLEHSREQLLRGDVDVDEWFLRCKDGSYLPVEVSAKILPDGNWLGIVRDITERREAEQALKKKEGELDTIFHYAPVIAFYKNRQGRFLRVNRLLAERLGTSEEALIGKNVFDLYPPEIAASMARDDNEVVATGRSKFGIVEEVETIFGKRWVQTDKIPTFGSDGEVAGLVGFATDITDRRQAEEQLRQAQKMEAMGTLVGGIAHDFNNMLAAIKANVYLAKIKLKGESALLERLSNIEQATSSAAEMVQQLLAFARKDIVATSVLSINNLLKEGVKLARAIIPENINYHVDICSEKLHIRGDATQLQQVLMNLLSNARDAVADVPGASITCSLTAYTADQAFRSRHAVKQDDFACWTVADNGCGIPAELQKKIFDPFFTTKEVGKGTGLGLAMMYAAIKSHAGVIEVESEPGRGTAFRLYLPITDEALDANATNQNVRLKGRGETILLVDDEESVRTSSRSVLEDLGYKVLEAADGERALQIFKASHGDIDLLMTDVIMPKLNGTDLVMCARALNKQIPVILVTGYDRGHVLDEHLQMERCDIISKPFNFDDLSQRIRTLLDANLH